MEHRGFLQFLCLVVLVTQIACAREQTAATSTVTSTPGKQRIITVGKRSDKPADIIDEYQPLADHLAANISDFDSGRVQVAADLETMAQWLASGEVDIYFDNIYASLVVADLSEGRPLVVRVKEGAPTKHGVFFTLADSGITSLGDLKGRVIAMEEPGSIVGFFAAVVHLNNVDLNPVEKTSPSVSAAPDEVGYAFSSGDYSTMQWVLSNKVPAGVVKIRVFNEFAETNPGKLVNLGTTEAITRDQLGVVRPGMDATQEQDIVATLLDLSGSDSGHAVMAACQTTRFGAISEDTALEIARIREMSRVVRRR